MLLKDKEGLYELKVDMARGIVYETYGTGLFTPEALKRMDTDYKTKVIPMLKGKKWAKFCDMRTYRMSNNVEEANAHVGYCLQNGMSEAAIIVPSVVLKMQMNRVGKNAGFAPTAFTEVNEAEQFLKKQGY